LATTKSVMAQLENLDILDIGSYLTRNKYVMVVSATIRDLDDFLSLLDLFTPEIRSAFNQVVERIRASIEQEYQNGLRELKRVMGELEEALKSPDGQLTSERMSGDSHMSCGGTNVRLKELFIKAQDILNMLENLVESSVVLSVYRNVEKSTTVVVMELHRDPYIMIHGEEREVDRVSEDLTKANAVAEGKPIRRRAIDGSFSSILYSTCGTLHLNIIRGFRKNRYDEKNY